MIIGSLDTDERVLVIAEIGNNHEGDFELAKDMINAAADSGADIVKFQTFQTEHYVSQENPDRVEMLNRFKLTFDQFAQLKEVADQANVTFISTPFDIESAQFLSEIVPAFKIASGDNTFYPLLRTIAQLEKPVLLSCGLASAVQVKYAQALINNIWETRCIDPGLGILHCVSSYPVAAEDANLAAIRSLAKISEATPGYSDHTLGTEAAVLSVACGARIIEKHFTLDKNYSDFRDHQISADPDEMKQLVRGIRKAEILYGSSRVGVLSCEEDNLAPMRRSIALTRDMHPGEVITPKDITWVRPSGGFPPGDEHKVYGHKIKRETAAFTILSLEDLEA